MVGDRPNEAAHQTALPSHPSHYAKQRGQSLVGNIRNAVTLLVWTPSTKTLSSQAQLVKEKSPIFPSGSLCTLAAVTMQSFVFNPSYAVWHSRSYSCSLEAYLFIEPLRGNIALKH